MQCESVSDKLFIHANNGINRIYYATFTKKISSNKSSLFHIILLIVSTFVLHKPIAKFLIVTDSQQPSEAIVILGGGLGLRRVIHAVKLYGKGLVSIIILTGQEMEFDGRKVRFKDIKQTEPRFAGILVKLYGIPEDTPVSLTFSPADNREFPLGGLRSSGKIRYILSEYVKIVYYMIRY